MTLDPETLEGRFVVEVGVRQAWPFLTFSDPRSEAAAEVRLYIDTAFRLEPGSHARATTTLLDLNNMSVTDVEVQDDGGLVLRFDGDNRALFVSGTAAHFTSHEIWWLETRSAGASDALLRLQQWYAGQRDGEWEHSYGVAIGTLDNPGWSLRVDLTGTALEGATAGWSKVERSEDDWLHWRIADGQYEAFCGPTNLAEAVVVFLDQASQAA